MQDGKFTVTFVCSGNICRSPMAEAVFRQRLREAGLADEVEVRSSGTGPWHVGDPMDERAAKVLAEHGYPQEHVAAQVGPWDLGADLVLAMDDGHRRELVKRVDEPANLRMFRSFDPAAVAEGELNTPDPYYGPDVEFSELLTLVEAAMPGLVDFVARQLGR